MQAHQVKRAITLLEPLPANVRQHFIERMDALVEQKADKKECEALMSELHLAALFQASHVLEEERGGSSLGDAFRGAGSIVAAPFRMVGSMFDGIFGDW